MDSLEAARRIPGSTYRLQLDRTFTFADALTDERSSPSLTLGFTFEIS